MVVSDLDVTFVLDPEVARISPLANFIFHPQARAREPFVRSFHYASKEDDGSITAAAEPASSTRRVDSNSNITFCDN